MSAVGSSSAGIPPGHRKKRTRAMPDEQAKQPNPEPVGLSGFFGLLARLRDLDIIAAWPGGWAKVFIVLYSRRNPQGFAWPSQTCLARDAGVDKRTVRRFLRWAKVALGIRVTRQGRHMSYYLPLAEPLDPFLSDHALNRKKGRKKAGKRTAQHPLTTEEQKLA